MSYTQRRVAVWMTAWLSLAPAVGLAQGQDARSLAKASRSKTLDQQARHIEELWASWSDLMREYTSYQVSQMKEPDQPGWVSWLLGSEGEKLDKIKSISAELLSHLKESDAQNLREKYFVLRDQIEAARLESIELAEDSYLAPEDGEAWFFQRSKEDYQELIKAKKEAIKAMRREQQQLIQDCHDSLVQMGIELTETQVKNLFLMKSGGAIFDLFVTFAHLNLLLELLTERMSDDSTGEQYAEESERYYSVYVALIGISLELHRETRRRLTQEDLAELDRMNERLEGMVKDTQQAIIRESKRTDAQSTEDIVQSYRENLKSQREIVRALKEYRGVIEGQLKSIEGVEREIKRQWDLSLNTYNTARMSRNYFGLVNRGLKDLNNLRKLKLPNMIPLMSDRLTSKLKTLDQYRGESIELRPRR